MWVSTAELHAYTLGGNAQRIAALWQQGASMYSAARDSLTMLSNSSAGPA
jgi:hypothetical protein